MLIWENIKFAFSALNANKIRSFLTMLGIIIGVFAVSILVAIGEGLRQEFSSQIESLGSNVVVVTPGKIDTENGTFNPSASFGVSTLTTDDAKAILEKVSTVERNAPMTLLSGTVVYEGQGIGNLLPVSTTEEYFHIVQNELAAGEYFTTTDREEKKRVVVLGGGAAEKIFTKKDEEVNGDEQAKDWVDKKIELLGEEFTIVGVLKTEEEALSFGGADSNDLVIIPRDTAVELTGEDVVFRILNKIRTAEEVEPAKSSIFDAVFEQHKDVEDFTVLTQEEVLNVFNNFFNILTQAIISIAAISLIVGGIGIMNIMLVSVTERTREIGLRKAIGATSGNILFQFLVEASALSIIGGVIGVGLAFATGIFVEQFFHVPTALTLKALLLAFSISTATGIVFGIMPASKASRKSPIEALRYE